MPRAGRDRKDFAVDSNELRTDCQIVGVDRIGLRFADEPRKRVDVDSYRVVSPEISFKENCSRTTKRIENFCGCTAAEQRPKIRTVSCGTS